MACHYMLPVGALEHPSACVLLMQSAAEAELQAVVGAGRVLSEAVLAAKDERAAAIAAVTRGLSYPVLPTRLPRARWDASLSSKAASPDAQRWESDSCIPLPQQKPTSPLKLAMPALGGPVSPHSDTDARGSGEWLLAAEHGSPVAQPPLFQRRA